MRQGEVWFLDASQIHSVAALSPRNRIHLMLDFVNLPSDRPLIAVEGNPPSAGIPADRVVARPPLSEQDRTELLRLADVLTMDTFSEIFSIVIKKHYRRDGGDGFIWNTILALAKASRDPAVLPHTQELHRYFTLERTA
jgi:hypothetical protein